MSAGSQRVSARDRLVVATIDLIQRRGVSASGLADILDRSGVSRRSVYLNFPDGKPQLVAEATAVAGAWIGAQIREHTSSGTPLEALARFVDQWATLLTDQHFDAGCPVVAGALAREVAPGATEAAAASFEDWTASLTETLMQHGVDAMSATSLATTIVAAVEGAVVMGLAMRSLKPLEHVEANLADLLRGALSR